MRLRSESLTGTPRLAAEGDPVHRGARTPLASRSQAYCSRPSSDTGQPAATDVRKPQGSGEYLDGHVGLPLTSAWAGRESGRKRPDARMGYWGLLPDVDDPLMAAMRLASWLPPAALLSRRGMGWRSARTAPGWPPPARTRPRGCEMPCRGVPVRNASPDQKASISNVGRGRHSWGSGRAGLREDDRPWPGPADGSR